MKPKANNKQKDQTILGMDDCQTPAYALDPLLAYLTEGRRVWEPAAGAGWMVRGLRAKTPVEVISTDIKDGQDFFQFGISEPYPDCNMIVTNPPYSLKYEWLEKCCLIGFPFALLMPVEMIGTAKGQRIFQKYGFQWIFLDKRVNFFMPHAGFSGHGAQFPVAWFCNGIKGLPKVSFAHIERILLPEEIQADLEQKERIRLENLELEQVLEHMEASWGNG